MKLALISDLHNQNSCLGALDLIIRKDRIDGVICSGDITTGDDTGYLQSIFEKISKANIEGFFIWGNSDQESVKRQITESEFNVHLQKRVYKGYKFFGLGYLEDYPVFDTAQIKDAIFITHRPPVGANLKAKIPNAPTYHISGHLHKPAFVKKYPSTVHIQVPTLTDGRYGLFEVESGSIFFRSI